MKKLYIITAILTMPAVCQAEDFYIGFGQSDDGSATSCATAASYLFYNTATNCGAGDGKISAGDRVLLCDDTGDFTTTLATPLACNGFSILAAPGESPVIDVSVGHGLNFANIGKQNITIGPGIEFAGWADGSAGVYFNSPLGGIRITGDAFTKADGEAASFATRFYVGNTAGYSLDDVEVDNNTYNLNQYTEMFSVYLAASSVANNVSNVNVHHNTANNISWGFRFLAPNFAAWQGPQGLRPYNIKFDDNVLDTIYADAVAYAGGVTENAGTSSTSRNHITNCGNAAQAAVNCLQLHWMNGVDINDNYINGVDTATCDGCGIILDWAVTDDTYISTNNNLLRNEIWNANAACGGKCISAYKGSGNTIEYNLCNGATDSAFKIGSNESTNNTLTHNTALNTPVCFSLADADNIGVTGTTITDSICDSPTSKGFEILNNSEAPTEARNFIYGAPANDITLDATDSTADPRLTATGRLKESSPARGACPSTTYFGSDCGAYTTQAGLLIPWNPALSISYNPGMIGPGRERPVTPDYLFFGSDQIFFGADALHF